MVTSGDLTEPTSKLLEPQEEVEEELEEEVEEDHHRRSRWCPHCFFDAGSRIIMIRISLCLQRIERKQKLCVRN